MKVQATIGVLAALAAASTGSANAATRSDVDVTATKPAKISPTALDQLSNELTVTDGKIHLAMPKVTGGPTWVQFLQNKR